MKYDIIFSCGHKGTVSLYGKRIEHKHILETYSQTRLCPECAKQKYYEELRNLGITLYGSFYQHVNPQNGSLQFMLEIVGNTYDNKDTIKVLGFKYEKYPYCFFTTQEKGWYCIIDICEVEDKINEVKEAFPDVNVKSRPQFALLSGLKSAFTEQDKWIEQKELVSSLTKPSVPAVLGSYYWNKKIYGNKDQKYIFLENKKVLLSDSDAEMLNKYVSDLEKYNKELDKINANTNTY